MGGELLENYDNVVASLRGLTDEKRFSLAMRNCTVSTVGIVPKIRDLLTTFPNVKMALSLHAPTQELREKIVPVSRKYGIDTLINEIDFYAERHESDGKRKGMVMISYIMIRDVNDTHACLEEMVQLFKKRNVVINLIPFNKFDPFAANKN